MERLDNTIQRYAWGSTTAIASLLGQPSDGKPQAELWLGAHPSAPSKLRSGGTLEELIARSPEETLGKASVARFGPKLPFLLKVLAAAQPLSLQAHPSRIQAQAGFAREEAGAVARDAAHRNYRDANHKPEVICALTPFDALCGFRRATDSLHFFRALGLDCSFLEKRGLRAYFEHVMTLPKAAQTALVDELVLAAQEPVVRFEAECKLASELNALYPHDIGILGAMLLNLVSLAPGEALYLDAGNLHAYLRGTGVELMANSDNVLRGGLTPKHVDVNELLSVLDFSDGPVPVLRANGVPEAVYSTPAPDFCLSRIELSKEKPWRLPPRGPQLLLLTQGTVTLNEVSLKQGESVFVGAEEDSIVVMGTGTLFRATTGLSIS